MINAVAGGGTLVSFPVLTAIGVPPVNANATNTIALCPGYIGGTYSLRREIDAAGEPLGGRMVAAGAGGFAGALLLLFTSNDLFRSIVPFLILLSCLLLAVQDTVRRWLSRRRGADQRMVVTELAGIFAAGVYGGYFGAGLGIMLIAVLGLFSTVAFGELNAVKQPLAAAINLSAAAFLVFSGKIEWTLVAAMAPASLVGGALGARLSTRIPSRRFRMMVVVFGIVVAITYLVR